MSETGNGRKNWTRVVAAVGLVFLAVAGGIVLANANKVINKTEKKDEETPLISIGFSQVGAESEWRTGNSISIKTTFSQKRGYDLIFKDAQQQQEQQIKAIRGFIQQDVNYIVLAPVVETGWDTVLKEAKKDKIPVIIADRQVKVKDDSLYTTWVGADFYQEGQKACSWMEQYAERNKKKTWEQKVQRPRLEEQKRWKKPQRRMDGTFLNSRQERSHRQKAMKLWKNI